VPWLKQLCLVSHYSHENFQGGAMLRLGGSDGKRARLQRRDQVKQILERNSTGGEGKIVQDLKVASMIRQTLNG
jgi:hypothetical protein